MKRKITRGIIITFLSGVVVFLYIILAPGSYHVPDLVQRPGTKYWNLPTGSGIAYTLIKSRGLQRRSPIIFLQGGPGGPIYDRNIKVLSLLAEDGFDIYLYDQIGSGLSDRLVDISGYSVDRHKEDLDAIIHEIGAPKVILIGQSWGALLAVAYIEDHPERVEKVIFTGPGPILPVHEELEKITAPDSLQLKTPGFTNRQGRKKAYNLRVRFVEFMAEKFNLKLASDKEMDDFASYLNHEMTKSTVKNASSISPLENGSGYYAMIKTVQSFRDVPDRRMQLNDCRIPVLLMRGQYDGIKWGYQQEYLQLFKNHKLVVVPDAGHSISIEQPLLYIRTIRSFLNQ